MGNSYLLGYISHAVKDLVLSEKVRYRTSNNTSQMKTKMPFFQSNAIPFIPLSLNLVQYCVAFCKTRASHMIHLKMHVCNFEEKNPTHASL
jgi:hypothetical protein